LQVMVGLEASTHPTETFRACYLPRPPRRVVAPDGSSYHAAKRRAHAMSEKPREWKYLERRPGSSYQQLCIKGKRIWAWTLYCESFVEKEPRTPEQLAADWGIPVEA